MQQKTTQTEENLSLLKAELLKQQKQPRRMTLLEWMKTGFSVRVARGATAISLAVLHNGIIDLNRSYFRGKLTYSDLTEQWEEVL